MATLSPLWNNSEDSVSTVDPKENASSNFSLQAIPLQISDIVPVCITGFTYTIGVCLNVMLLVTIRLRHELQRPTYLLILNLSIGDIIFCVVVAPLFIATRLNRRQLLFGVSCELAGLLSHGLAYQSMYMLILLTVDRCWAICRPLRSQALRENAVLYRVLSAATWIMAAILASPPLFGLGSYKFFPDIYGCQLTWGQGLGDILYTMVVLGPLMFYPGCGIMVFVYVNIFRTVRRTVREEHNGHVSQHNVLRRELKAAKSILIIVGIFVIGWFPFVGLRQYSQITGWRLPAAENYSQVLFVLPCVLNPVVYGWMNQEFKAAFIKHWNIRHPALVDNSLQMASQRNVSTITD